MYESFPGRALRLLLGYASFLINPEDNKANLDEDYIEDVFEILPEKEKARFHYGQWVKGEGCIYDRFVLPKR